MSSLVKLTEKVFYGIGYELLIPSIEITWKSYYDLSYLRLSDYSISFPGNFRYM